MPADDKISTVSCIQMVSLMYSLVLLIYLFGEDLFTFLDGTTFTFPCVSGFEPELEPIKSDALTHSAIKQRLPLLLLW